MGLHGFAVPPSPGMESELLKSTESRTPSLRRGFTNTLSRRGHSWTVEVISLILSVGTLGAICIILPLYDGKPLDAWTFVLSLNTIVSILGATSRASMGFALSAAFGQEKWNWYRSREDRLLTFDRFDEATRGPWGSLKLLWHLKFKHWTALGALAMAVLLGFEPFLQALIQLEGQLNAMAPDKVQQPATISRSAGTLDMGRYIGDGVSIPPEQRIKLNALSTRRNKSTAADWAASLVSARYFSRPDFGLTGAIIAGLSSSSSNTTSTANQAWNPSFSCSSGNCTWTPFTSLGVCSKCNDVSANIQSSTGVAQWCKYGNKPDDCNSPVTIKWKGVGGLHPGYDLLNYTSHRLSLPGAANLLLSNWHLPYAGTQCPLCETATLVSDTSLSPESTLTFQDMTSMIISWVYMAADKSYSEGRTEWKDTPVTAHECSLYFCTQAIKSRVENGQLFEESLGTWTLRRPLTSSQELELYPEIQTSTESLFTNTSFMPWLLSATSRGFGNDWGRNNSTLTFYIPRSELTRDISTTLTDEDLEFNVTRATMGALIRYLAMDLSGLNTRYYNNNSNLTSWNTQLIYPPDFYGNTLLNGPTPPLINSLGEASNITAMMESVAASMTKFLRDNRPESESINTGNSFPTRARVQIGETQVWTLHIRVRWEYLALPAAVLLLGCAVVVAVIVRSRRLGLPAWRGSALVTLARGLDPKSRDRLRAADCADDFRSAGREMRVSLVSSSGDGLGPQLTAREVTVGSSLSSGYEDIRIRRGFFGS